MYLITLSAPSKTFLVGEYIALSGGPTLILNTLPRFELIANITQTNTPCKQQGIRISSPAGKFLKSFSQQFIGYQLSFKDPHKKAGGFGASSAQFAMVYVMQNIFSKQKKVSFNISALLQQYLQCNLLGNGPAPSGADVIAQILGHISFYYYQQQQIEQFNWPFDKIDFCLIRTGQKIATHQHLAKLDIDTINMSELVDISLQTYQAIQQNHDKQFVTGIQQYGDLLDKLELVAPHTQQMLFQIKQNPHVLATKGCGAMGADVILIIFESQQRDFVFEWLNHQSFDIAVFGHEQLSNGIQCSELTSIELEY